MVPAAIELASMARMFVREEEKAINWKEPE